MTARPLQITLAVLALIPVLTGLLTMMGQADPIYADAGLPAHALLDSNLRFFGGLWLVLGLSLYAILPRIAEHTALYRALWAMIFMGGLGRLLSMMMVGWPPLPFVAFTVLELVGAPLFVLWQSRVAQAAREARARQADGLAFSRGAPATPPHRPARAWRGPRPGG